MVGDVDIVTVPPQVNGKLELSEWLYWSFGPSQKLNYLHDGGCQGRKININCFYHVVAM